ncbi:MAG: MATE family efflux transporter [Gemmataceae bacterium]|nr:MATE family efflux transporter [Gemmataceae bacterium]
MTPDAAAANFQRNDVRPAAASLPFHPEEEVSPANRPAVWSAPTWGLVLFLALPVLAQQGLHFLVNLSDRFLAGHIQNVPDLPALQSAQTTAHYLAWFINCYGVFVTAGSTALVARFVGAGDQRQAVAVLHQSLLLAVFFALTATAAAFAGGVPAMVALLQQRGAAAEYTAAYLYPLFGLLVCQMVESAGVACLVGAGDTRTGLWVFAGVAAVNVPLAWGLCRGLWGFPELGFRGIAWGTALAHGLGCLAVVVVLLRGRYGLRLSWRQFWPRFDLMRRLLRVGIPAGIDSMSIVIGQFWFLSIVNQLGEVASAAHGIALIWEALGYLSGAAFGTAAMALVGQNLGAGRPSDAARAGWRAYLLATAVMSAMGAVFFTFAPEMFAVFCPQPQQQPIIVAGIPALRLVAFAMPALASTIVLASALRGAGDTRVPVLFTWLGFFAVRIPLGYLLTRSAVVLGPLGELSGWDLGLLGAWWAMVADLFVRGAIYAWRFGRGAWKHQRV